MMDACEALIPPFSRRMGFHIEGSASTPLSAGVDIKIIAAGDGPNTPFQKGESALETTTGGDGFFANGIEASKAGNI